MTPESRPGPGFWPVVKLLLRAARSRAAGRVAHQQKLLNHRHKKKASNWGGLMLPLMILFGVFLHGMFAFGVTMSVMTATRLDSETNGKMVVGQTLIDAIREPDRKEAITAGTRQNLQWLNKAIKFEARTHQRTYGGTAGEREQLIQNHLQRHGSSGFISEHELELNLTRPEGRNFVPLAGLVGLLMLVWWFTMVTFQGEGLELDVQRRRHPMWEWLLSHPVKPGAVFFAEMLAPLAANPNMIAAPVFWVVLLLVAGHGAAGGIIGGILIGVPLAAAAACASKAVEINAMLRLSPRNRGALLGFMSWLGYAAFVGMFFITSAQGVMLWLQSMLLPVAGWCDWSLAGHLLGLRPEGTSTVQAVALWWCVAAAIIVVSLRVAARATERGLAGGFGGTSQRSETSASFRSFAFIKDMLQRKELLWFWRDRGAVVQTLLIPCTIAGLQAFNLRGLVQGAQSQWNWLCGLAVLFGTYFLFILGPRSLVSEGPALWLALTWPRGLENLLRAKAKLWWMFATAIVSLALLGSAFLHPAAWWKILLVALGWWAFSRSLALKSVTLVQAPSSSGEPEPIPKGRQWAATLGTFTFAAGIASAQWHLAFAGVVYSWVTAAAMWQNFRERLPFLYDPWSEKLPRPPTVTHAMVAIMAMIECGAIAGAISGVIVGPDRLWFARSIAYGIAGLLTWIIMSSWLKKRDVPNHAVWHWETDSFEKLSGRRDYGALFTGLGAGTLLGLLAWAYSAALIALLPGEATELNKTAAYLLANPSEHWWFAALVMIAAPLAEEYLFRGLLFRALDREWGGWKAVLGSAMFFAIYHPPDAWLPVASLGVLNALLFRRSRSLWPCVLAHLAYNGCITLSLHYL